ncbi:HTH_48 domain-containing protein [Trichonephila clavipes]|nr:HTH_48 domain-containing protein [Trichonephila clavipes]
MIADPIDRKVRSVIRFLDARNVKIVEIHRQLLKAHGENVMDVGMMRKWIRLFNDGCTNNHDDAPNLRSSAVNH